MSSIYIEAARLHSIGTEALYIDCCDLVLLYPSGARASFWRGLLVGGGGSEI